MEHRTVPTNIEAEHTLTKADLVEQVHQQIGVSKKEANGHVETMLEIMKSSLERGQKVKISGFGSFVVRDKKARKGRNPQTDNSIVISARKVLTFKASQILKSAINEAFPGSA
jgi:integration host factor subunit alpha